MTKKRKIRIGDTVNVVGRVVDQKDHDKWIVYFPDIEWERLGVMVVFEMGDCGRVVKGKNDD